MTEQQLSALLRLKRYETPPPQYFDRLLQDLHRRQRAELLRRPLWKIAAERVQTFFGEHSMGSLSYAGALASVLAVGLGTIGLVTSGGGSSIIHEVAKKDETGPIVAPAISKSRLVTLQTTQPQSNFNASPLPQARVDQRPVVRVPRYIIDTRPASYESVNF